MWKKATAACVCLIVWIYQIEYARMILSYYFIFSKLESSVLNNRNQVWNHAGSSIIIGYKPPIKTNGPEIFTSECLFLWACITRGSSLWGIWIIDAKIEMIIFRDRFIVFLSTIGGSTKTKNNKDGANNFQSQKKSAMLPSNF